MYDELPTVYFQIHELPLSCWPARARRHRGVTLVWIQPGALKAEAVFWARDNLNELERVAVRRAFGQGDDLRFPVEDRICDGEMTDGSIPQALRVPGARVAQRSA